MIKTLIIAGLLTVASSLSIYAQGKSVVTTASLTYHLSWDGKSPLLDVKLEYTAATTDSTVFIFGDPNMGGQTEIFKVLQNIRCEANSKLKIDDKARKITIYHTHAKLNTINYQVNGRLLTDPKRATLNELFRPLITGKSLYLVPLYFMLNPVNQGADSVSIKWDKYPRDYPYFISIAGGSSAAFKQTIAIKQEKDVLILMGPDLDIKLYKVRGIPYYCITSKSDTINNLKQDLKPFFKSYFPGLRDFWHDNSGPYYYTCILPLLAIDKPWATGFSWGHGFIMKYSGLFDNEKKHVLAHETSHNWIGGDLQIGSNEFDNQWFGEGFNDYVSVMAQVKAGIMDNQSFLNYVNKNNLAEHYGSNVKSAPNDSIVTKFWTDKNYQTLPYKRGFIYAFYLDNEIKLASSGRKSIRDLLLKLFMRNKAIKAKDADSNLTISDFVSAASEFIPEKEIKQQINTYMLKGTPIDFKKLQLIDAFKISYDGEIPVLSLNNETDLKKIYSW